MQNKILYRSGKFYALRLPRQPIHPSANQDTERAWRRYESDLKYYNQQVESIKANSPEIVNANDLIKEFDFIDGEAKINPSFKDGDTFPLPSNMRFEEEIIKHCETLCENSHCKIHGCMNPLNGDVKVVRIVKAETKETMQTFQQTMCSGTISYSNGLCDKCGMPAVSTSNKCIRMVELVPQPEPEESQEDLLYAIRTMESIGASDEAILQRFTFKRK